MKIICIGRNYADHAKELNNPVPAKPVVFMKPPTALLVNNKPFYYPEYTKDLHYEVEVVLKIAKNGRHIPREFAHEWYEEIGLGIDFTARDIQSQCKAKGHPWEIAKAFDHSAVLGSFMPKSEFNTSNIEFELTKNGEQVQFGKTKDMIFSFEDILVYVSKFFRLQMGDYIYTGTPKGVGAVAIGDKLEGFLHTHTGAKRIFHCDIK